MKTATFNPRALVRSVDERLSQVKHDQAAGRWPTCRDDGTAWSLVPAPVGSWFGTDLWVVSSTEAWAVSGGAVIRWDGSAWSTVPTRGSPWLAGIWQSPSGDVWVVGEGRAILRRPAP